MDVSKNVRYLVEGVSESFYQREEESSPEPDLSLANAAEVR